LQNRQSQYTSSIIVPVYREQETINPFIRRLTRTFPLEKHQIIVVDGSRNQETLAALDVPGVMGIVSERGRGKQMNAGAAKARSGILLFIHADTFLPGNAPGLIQTAFKNRNLVGGAFSLGIASSKWSFRLIEAAANVRSSLTRVPYGDQAIFMRREFFEKMGGFREIPIMEDLEFMTRIRKSGGRISILRDKAMTSPRRWEKEGAAMGTLRNWLIRILYHCGVSPEKLSGMYK